MRRRHGWCRDEDVDAKQFAKSVIEVEEVDRGTRDGDVEDLVETEVEVDNWGQRLVSRMMMLAKL